MTALVIGVDPGVTTGIVALHTDEAKRLAVAPLVYQAHGTDSVLLLVKSLIEDSVWDHCWIAVEKFVVSTRSGRSTSAAAGQETRELIGALGTLGVQTFHRAAGIVKPWATDRRLESAGLIAVTHQMRHARDAARHALFAAVNLQLMHDPMSQAASR